MEMHLIIVDGLIEIEFQGLVFRFRNLESLVVRMAS